jgi:hypothetical protein
MISGFGVFYPDGTPTERVGIHVDVEEHPSVQGIRAGRDEVLEASIGQIVPGLSPSEIEKLARPDQTKPQRGNDSGAPGRSPSK